MANKKRTKVIFSILIGMTLAITPFLGKAVMLDSLMSDNVFKVAKSIELKELTGDNHAYVLYDLTNGDLLGGGETNPIDLAPVIWNVPFPVAGHNYSVIEVTVNTVCEDPIPLTYEECKNRSEFVNEVLFSVANK